MDDYNSGEIHPSFNLPQERIDEMSKTILTGISYFKTIQEFADWVDSNLQNLDVEQVYSIYEDFVISNKHIIDRINKILPEPIK